MKVGRSSYLNIEENYREVGEIQKNGSLQLVNVNFINNYPFLVIAVKQNR